MPLSKDELRLLNNAKSLIVARALELPEGNTYKIFYSAYRYMEQAINFLEKESVASGIDLNAPPKEVF